MTVVEAAAANPLRVRPWSWGLVWALVAVPALTLRLVPVLIGGGLFGRGNYDDGVYYAASAAFVHGLLPYRDFLLLHPPGIVLALAPFAKAGQLLGDPVGLAIARVFFMAVGTANAVLVAVALRRAGRAAAAAGGIFYAVFFPAVYVEHTTLLEPLATTCLLAAVCLLTAKGRGVELSLRTPLAGVLLGCSASLKIWGVVPAVVLLVWLLAARGPRRAGLFATGVVLGAVAVCLPFFVVAPGPMWRMVVTSQLGRPRNHGLGGRLSTMAGWPLTSSLTALEFALTAVVVGVALLLAVRTEVGRLGALLLVASVGLLLATPSWFLHYAAFAAGPAALVAGAAVGRLTALLRSRVARAALAAVGLVAVAAYAGLVSSRSFGQPFPTDLAPAVATARCVTTDDPVALVELNVLQHNLDAGCPFVADLGGNSYYDQPGHGAFVQRKANAPWQQFALNYLRSGTVSVEMRFSRHSGWSLASAHTVSHWPLLARSGGVSVRRPLAADDRSPTVGAHAGSSAGR